MSDNQGATAFFTMLDTLRLYLLEDPNINTCTYGDLAQIDLSKQTIFPLAHLVPNTATVDPTGQTITFNVSVILMDIVDVNKALVTDQFTGNTDEMDILNTQLQVGNKLVEQMRNGNLFNEMYQVITDATFEPFYDRFENELAGWSLNVSIVVQNDIYIC